MIAGGCVLGARGASAGQQAKIANSRCEKSEERELRGERSGILLVYREFIHNLVHHCKSLDE